MSVLVSIVAVGLLIALHEAGHFAAARLTGMKVVRFSVGFFPLILKWRSRRTGITYQLGALPLGGFVQIKGMNPFEEGALEDPDSYQRQPVWKRAAVIASGPAANFLVAWALLFGLYASGVPEPVNEPVVGAVEEGGPAEEAGLMAGDRVVEIDGVPVATWIDLARAMHERPEREVDLLVERGGSRTGVKVTPERRGDIGLIGIHQPTEIVSLAPHVAALAALAKCAGLVTDTLAALGGWIAGTSDDVEPVGPVGASILIR